MNLEVPLSVALPSPTRGRYKVLAFLCVLALILYIDRICLSQAVTSIERDLGIDDSQMGRVHAAFTLAYCLFEVPMGWWGDRYGSRGVMTRIVVWWSAFTALTGAALGLWPLLAIRFLFGAGEAGALPNTARILARWFPAGRRGPAQGMINTTALVGGALSPTLAAYLIEAAGWRWAFVCFAAPGLVWAVLFHRWFRDNPAAHPAVNEAERQLIGSAPIHASPMSIPQFHGGYVLRSANVWLLGGVIACSAFNTYLYFSWYPTYLQKGRGVDMIESGLLSSLVLAGGALGCAVGGFLSDALIRRTGNRRASRRGLGCAAMGISAVLLLIGLHTDAPTLAALWTAFAVFTLSLTLASWWGAVTDISGRHLGALFGLMNSIGGLGAMSSQLFVGRFADWMKERHYEGRAQWDPAFYVYAAVLVVGAVGWLAIDTTGPIEPLTVEVPPSADTGSDAEDRQAI